KSVLRWNSKVFRDFEIPADLYHWQHVAKDSKSLQGINKVKIIVKSEDFRQNYKCHWFKTECPPFQTVIVYHFQNLNLKISEFDDVSATNEYMLIVLVFAQK
ncbi:hypothetical protein PV325_009162, partial [Microctonus aethiopoides]